MKAQLKYTLFLASILSTMGGLSAAQAQSTARASTQPRAGICNHGLTGASRRTGTQAALTTTSPAVASNNSSVPPQPRIDIKQNFSEEAGQGLDRFIQTGFSNFEAAPLITEEAARFARQAINMTQMKYEIRGSSGTEKELIEGLGYARALPFIAYMNAMTEQLNQRLRANGEPPVKVLTYVLRTENGEIVHEHTHSQGWSDLTTSVAVLGNGTYSVINGRQIDSPTGTTTVFDDGVRARRFRRNAVLHGTPDDVGPQRLIFIIAYASSEANGQGFNLQD